MTEEMDKKQSSCCIGVQSTKYMYNQFDGLHSSIDTKLLPTYNNIINLKITWCINAIPPS